MTTASSIPATLDALVAMCKTVAAGYTGQPAGGKVLVIDGPQKHNAQTVIAVGHGAATHDGTALAATETISGLVLGTDMESYDVACVAESWAGNGTYSKLRGTTFGLVNAIVDALAADKTLGGVVMRANVKVLDYVPALTDKGPSVVVPFHIHIDARRSLS
jgi:hypothetical protein